MASLALTRADRMGPWQKATLRVLEDDGTASEATGCFWAMTQSWILPSPWKC